MNEIEKEQTVLIVDDDPGSIQILSRLLMPEYGVRVAKNGEKALEIILSEERPDLILLDVMMPGMDGYEVCRRIKCNPETQDIPVIFLTAKSKTRDEEMGFDLGAVDYMTKPVSPSVALARVATHLQMKKARDFLIDKTGFMEQEIERRTKEVANIQDVTVYALSSLAETRDSETGKHIKRTQQYVKLLADHLKHHPRFCNSLSDKTIEMLYKTAPLHDIGKVGIPDHILLKPGKLTDAEFDIMKTHTRIGRNAILNAEKLLNKPAPFLFYAREIAYTHHEKWDGKGYPERLSGNNIPVSGRIMAMADVYDALITRRIYKQAFAHTEAVDIVKEESGRHFDPEMVAVFLDIAAQFYEIGQQYSD